MVIGTGKQMRTLVMPVRADEESKCREYAGFSGRRGGRQEKPDFSREREKLKEALLPFVREAVKKQLKEERDYYRSRPSMAARQLESVLGQGQLLQVVAEQVCGRVERRMQLERIRRQ